MLINAPQIILFMVFLPSFFYFLLGFSRKKRDRFFDLLHVHLGINARTKGPFIKNAKHWQRERIDNTAAKVPLACNRYNRARPALLHNASGYSSSCCHKELQVFPLANLYKVADITPAAPLAVGYVISDTYIAIADLDAMRQQYHYRVGIIAACPYKPVVEPYHKKLQSLSPALKKGACNHQCGIKQF
jgi:hypothetical protein